MRAGAQLSDSDSDETIVEGSVTESDLDEEELHVKRLSPVNKDITRITEVIFTAETEEINRGLECLSPEIQCVSKFSNYLQKVSQEIRNSEQSQSLLQGERDCPVFTTTVSQTGLQLSTSEKRWQNDSGAVGTEEPGFLTEPERERFNDEDDCPEESLLSGAIAKETFMVPEESTRQNIFSSVLKDCHSASMTITELDAKVKDSVNTDTAVLSAPPEKIFKEAFTAQRIMADEFEIQDLLKPLSESESPKMINFLHDMLECQDDVLSVDTLGDKMSNALPEDLLTALNSLSESLVQPVYQLAETKRELHVMEEYLRSEPSISQRDDDCTQIADTIESWFYTEQLKERKVLTESKLQNIKDEQLAGDQKKNDIVIADYWNVTSSDREANEGNSSSNKTILGVETRKTTPYSLRRSARLKENFTKKMQESVSKDSEDQCSELGDDMCKRSTLDINNQDKQIRRSQRIAKRIEKQTSAKKSLCAAVFSIPLSTINSKNVFGEILLHRAVTEEDIDLVHDIIEAGANANAQDYGAKKLNAQRTEDRNLHQLGVNSNVPVQHSHINYGETAKKCYVKPSSRQNSVSNAKVPRLLNEKTLKDARLVPTKKSVTGSTRTSYIAKNKNSQKFSDHKTNMSLLDASKGKPSTNHKTHDSKFECNTRFTVANLSSKRITASSLHQSSSPENVCEVSEKSSMHQQAEVQQHPDISDSINAHPLSEEKETAYKSSTSSVTIKEQRVSLQYTALSVTVEEASAEQPETELTKLDSHSVFSMCKEDGMPLVKAKEYFMNHDNEDHCLKHTKEDSMIEKSMIERSLDTAKSIPSEQIIYSNNCSQQIECDTDREKNNEEEQSLYPSLPLSEHSSLERSQLQSGNLTPFSAQKAVNLPESDCAFLSEQYSVNEKQKIYKHLSQDINNCIGQTLQRNTETFSVHESLEPTNGGSVFEMPDSYSNSTPSHFADQIDEEMGMVLGSKINAERCYREKMGVVNNSESNPSIALQLNEKVVMQLKRKRQDLQEINQDTDLCSTSTMDKNSLNPCELTQETQQEISQKSDEGKTAGVGGAQNTGRCCTEKSEEERNAKNDLPITPEAIQNKRIRTDLRGTIYNTDLCSNNSKNKHSRNPSQFSQAAEQDSSNKSGWTAIHEASKRGFTEVILELLKAGADVNSKGPDGILPIHDAVSGNYFKAVSILLQHGANPNEKDSDGNTALDKACSDKMKELLKSYGAADTSVPQKATEVTDIPPSRSRRSPQSCYDCCKMADEPLILDHDKAREKHDMHESINTVLQDIEEKQKKLLLFELRTPKDAEMYIQRLSQIQDTLNGMLAKQKTERDTLAKKYRASVESFKQGALRDQLVQLASRQKSLLMVAKKQKELGQKIQNCRNAKKAYSGCSKKQIPDAVPSTENDDRECVTPDKRVHPDVVTVSMGPDVRLLNGNRLEAHLSLESRFSAQEHSQYQNGSLDEAGANERAIRSKVVSAQALASENMVREWTVDKMSKSKSADAMEMVTLLSEPVCITHTECSQQEEIDYTGIAVQGSKSPNPIAETSRLNISEAQNIVVNNNIHQPTTHCQQVPPGKKLQNYANRNEASQQQPREVSGCTENSSVGLQQNNRTSPNANLEPTSFAPNIFYSININQNSSSQFSHRQEKEQQLSNRKCRRKKSQLLDLLELGKIKPGEDVLEFKLQDFSHKATLLRDGRIQTSENRIHGNPVQWVKALLGNDISVSWKYAWNKVVYLGTELSKLLVEEASVPNKPEVTSQLKEPSESSIQFDLVKNSTNFLHFSEILLMNTEEFLPCHLMEQYWKFYIQCEDFGF